MITKELKILLSFDIGNSNFARRLAREPIIKHFVWHDVYAIQRKSSYTIYVARVPTFAMFSALRLKNECPLFPSDYEGKYLIGGWLPPNI